MRFGLLGDHPDGVDLSAALVDSGRHSVVATTASLSEDMAARLGQPIRYGDLEEILANPAVECVIVAGSLGVRSQQLRRAIQSERPVLCVHPADEKPDTAYEAAMMQQDTGHLLFPVQPESLHPGIRRLAEFVSRDETGPVGAFRLLTYERQTTGEVLESIDQEGLEPSFPGWDILRRLVGELAEVSSFAHGEEPEPGLPVLLAGRFESGGLFQTTLIPRQPAAMWRLTVVGTRGQAALTWPQGWHGPAFLNYRKGVESCEEYFPPFDPWPVLVVEFENALARKPGTTTWQDEVRALELDDAARRSVERRRVNLMEYQDANEEVGFKGTMTLVGCGVLWGVILLLIISRWLPWMGWVVLPLLLLFVALQLLRYIIPPQK